MPPLRLIMDLLKYDVDVDILPSERCAMSGPLQIRVSLSVHAVSTGNKRKRHAAELVPSCNDLERGVNTEHNWSNKGRDFQSPAVSAEEV